ncbi:hypothetical protein [Terrimonas pollutisoli]|uniref:hypothetical protein n=1 Tax=Terrimonas pollutisoli TaxID=3034147 RepID=UPI0023EDC310|nr:hypothetical protein [Terrimonas sp. H1YJ31]
MLNKIKRQDCLDKYPKFPLRWYDEIKEDLDYSYPEVYYSYVLTIPSKFLKGHIKLLGSELTVIANALGFDTLIFLGDTNVAWLSQNNDFKPAKDALQFLTDNKVGKRFNGALQVDKAILPIFIKHLSWLSRCNAALPYFYFTDTGQNIIGTICQYGNLHIDTVNEKTDMIFKDVIIKTQFEFLTDKICSEQFSNTGAIKGREITY